MITPEEMRGRLIQAMARAIYEDRNGFGCRKFGLIGIAHQKPYLADATAVLTAIETQGLAIVPVEATDAQFKAGVDMQAYTAEAYRAMIQTGKL